MDIRLQRTRQMLVDAFEQLLQENRSLENISVSELCETSTVRRATFYRHFEDKYAFYSFYLEILTMRFLEAVDGNFEGDDSFDLRQYVERMHEQLISFSETHPALAKSAMSNKVLAGTLDMIMNQMAEAMIRKINAELARNNEKIDAPIEFISTFYSGGVVHSLRWWLNNGKPISSKKMVQHASDMFLDFLESKKVKR